MKTSTSSCARPRPTTAFALGAKTADPLLMYLNDVCTIPSNLTGHPAISVPFGRGDDGLPVGVQIMGPALSERLIFRVCRRAGAGRARHGEPAVSAAGPGPEAPLPDGWELVVGLEVHVEMSTATKLFCGCANRFGDEPNTNVCPVCLGLPGSLPVVNETAVDCAMRLGRALGCEVRPAVFARKNYFYPDMPKDYQISQYDQPTNTDGRLELPDGHVVGIERAHIEEDTGKTTHIGGGGAHPRRRLRPGGLQPGRRAPGGDRQPPRNPHRRAGPGLCARAAGHPAGSRRVRCPDGGGLNAGGRQRVGAALRLRRAAHPLRDQEPEFAALPGPCRSPSKLAATWTCGRAGSGPARRPATGTRRAGAPRRAAPRRTPRTTATSRTPTWCRWHRRPRPSLPSTRRCPRCPRRDGPSS